jgi:hypothetical protein
MADDLGEGSRTRTLLAAVGAMVAVALVLGLVVGLVALGAAHVAGMTGAESAAPSEPASVYIPRYRPTEPAAPARPKPRDGGASPARRGDDAKPKPRSQGFTLRAGPVRVSPGERINLTGDYRGRGSTLEVQRREAGGAWADFAGVTASVSGGSYQTWVQTSRTGAMRFRMYSPASRRTSNVVVVTVG